MTADADAPAATTVEAPAPAGADRATASTFTMLPGAAGAMVCEGDICYVPGVASDVE